jgi:tetratricopeptide (TPR) repeat protein
MSSTEDRKSNDPSLPDFDARWDYDRPGETEQAFRALLPQAEASGDRGYRIELLTQVARAEGLQRRFGEAHATLDAAEGLLEPGLRRARVRYLLERGRVFNSSGQAERARPFFQEALELAEAAGEDFYAVDAAHMLGIANPPEEQLGWSLKALELAERSAEPRARKWLGALYNNIAWSYHDLGRYDEALAIFEKALAWRQEQGQVKPIRSARWGVGRALRSLGRIEEALAVQRALEEEWTRTGETSGYVEEELGECLLALGETNAARAHFARAHAELSKDPWLAENEPARLARLAELGRVA